MTNLATNISTIKHMEGIEIEILSKAILLHSSFYLGVVQVSI